MGPTSDFGGWFSLTTATIRIFGSFAGVLESINEPLKFCRLRKTILLNDLWSTINEFGDCRVSIAQKMDYPAFKAMISGMWIERAISERILKLSRSFPAVLITGARQTGKTSLMRRLFPDADFVSLELPSVIAQWEADPAPLLNPATILLDEVQNAPFLFRYLKAQIDRDRHALGRFILSGSQKFGLMKHVAESLAGRCAIVELESLSSVELSDANLVRAEDASNLIWRGGFPELHRQSELDPREFYASYVATYLQRDLRSQVRIGSLRDFERFMRLLASRAGQLLNLAEFARDLGIAGSTARDWISTLEAANLIVMLEPYFGNFGKRLVKTPKVYFADTGLLCFLLTIESPESLVKSPFLGAIWENFVLAEMLKVRSATGSSAKVYFWRDVQGVEVDFVIESAGRLRLVECKWASEIPKLDSRSSLLKVAELLGKNAAEEHWLACRTTKRFMVNQSQTVAAISAFANPEWFAE